MTSDLKRRWLELWDEYRAIEAQPQRYIHKIPNYTDDSIWMEPIMSEGEVVSSDIPKHILIMPRPRVETEDEEYGDGTR